MTTLRTPDVFDEDSDDDGPIVFRRNSITPKQSQPSSAPKTVSSQKRAGLSGRPGSDQSALNGEASNSQKVKVSSNAKVSTGSSTAAKSRSLASATYQLSHSSDNMASNDIEMSHPDKACGEAENSDDSDDDKPLSSRHKSSSVAIQKSSSVHAQKTFKHSPGNTFKVNDTNKMMLDRSHGKAECSDDSDDEKPLSAKFYTAPVAVQAHTSHGMESLKSPMRTSSPLQNIKEDTKCDSDDSEDDKPLTSRLKSKSFVGGSTKKSYESDEEKPLQASRVITSPMPTPSQSQKMKDMLMKHNDDSDDDKPLVSRFQSKSSDGTFIKKLSDSAGKPLNSRLSQNGSSKNDSSTEFKTSKNLNKRPLGDVNNYSESSSKKAKKPDASAVVKVKPESVVKKELKTDDDDHIPIAQRLKKSAASDKESSTKKVKKVISSSLKKDHKKTKKNMKNSNYSKSLKVPPGSGDGQKWTTLQHSGVIFPLPYKPHGIKMLYNGQPVALTPDQEEVATMFAVMKDTDYATKPKFIDNFWNDWRQILGRNHVIKKFELCDFTPIYEWHLKEKEKKKQMSSEDKKALKEDKMKQEEKYMWAIVDGVKEKVGNFRVEPPGLFRGRGEHPKMGKLKRRIQPSDITINIGRDAPIPECFIPGGRWKEVRHDNTVTWLAFWNDPINPKEFKYVFLAASSSLKGQSDKEKYEKARLLKDHIHAIRATYTKDFSSKDATRRQIAVATYLIDKLALRAGNEKDDDEADTVGCCTLKVENVELVPPNKLQFDFLGKDSIRYFNTVEVELPVYKAIGDFRTAKKSNVEKKGKGDDLFDMLDTSKLNAHLKELMPGLTAKVFRTYNASITLDEMLSRETKEGTLPEKVVVYQHANKEVAIICNHQRSVSKSHDAQMSRLNDKIDELKAQHEEFKVDLSRARKGKPPLKDAEGKTKKNLAPEVLVKKLAQVDAKIEKMELDKKIKDDLKTVALGTSKINYLDPRITVAWCKRHEVPIEKIFNKSLLAKFSWAMEVDPSFRF